MEGFCRGCLLQYNDPDDLFQYTEKSRRLFVYSTGLQVKRNDSFIFQLCKECYFNMKQSCKFKKQCRTSDKKFKSYLMVKDEEDGFGNFIKNLDEDFSIRLPLTLGQSTPAHQKNKDDDNDSTCTSIRNFMTDILDDEEMAPTEARIIREVIEEEADVMDDSLDSRWLEDDLSVGDLEVSFGFSPFTTPRSVQNDPRYTLIKTEMKTEKQQENYFTSKEIIEKINKPKTSQTFDMPLLDIDSSIEFDSIDPLKKEVKVEDLENIDIKDTELLDLNNSIPSDVADMVTENSISSTFQRFKSELLADIAIKKEIDMTNDNSTFVTFDEGPKVTDNAIKTENEMCIVLNQGTVVKSIDKVPLTNEIEFYMNKAELKKQIIATDKLKEYHCTIDRNLDIALNNEGSKEFSLEQLITTPAVSIRSTVSTPTIKNILFGEKDKDIVNSTVSTPTIKKILFGDPNTKTPKYFPQVGQSIDNFEDDKSYLEDLVNDEVNTNKLKDTELNELKDTVLDIEKQIQDYGINKEIKSDEHIDVLEEFLQGADNLSPLDNNAIDEIIDPQDLFKRPQTPPHDKYDLDKGLCKICHRTFNSSKSLKIHFAKIHKYKLPNLDPYRNRNKSSAFKVCNICGLGIKGATCYSRHMKKHKDELIEYFECDHCKMFFKNRKAIQLHVKMHMGIVNKPKDLKKFVCSICGKVSANSSNHKLHMRRHLKATSVTCEICHRGYYSEFDLKAHMMVHSGERPFACQYCSKTYRRRDLLYHHMKRHLGKFEFHCDVCNVGFVTKQILAHHYGSKKCMEKRQGITFPRKSNENIKKTSTVRSSKGSIEKIRQMMQYESEKDDDEIEDVVIQDTDPGALNSEENCAVKIEDSFGNEQL